MKIVYSRSALKDVKKIKEEKLKTVLLEVIISLKEANNLSEISNVKKLSGHPEAYRIRIGNYRLAFFYTNNCIEIARFLKREDIYKVFP